MTFRVSRRHEELAVVEADTVGEAATKHVRRLYGDRAMASRTTGDHGKSGYFQAYTPQGVSAWSSRGESFHVGEA